MIKLVPPLPDTVKQRRDLQKICDLRTEKLNKEALFIKNLGLPGNEFHEKLKSTRIPEPEVILARALLSSSRGSFHTIIQKSY